MKNNFEKDEGTLLLKLCNCDLSNSRCNQQHESNKRSTQTRQIYIYI